MKIGYITESLNEPTTGIARYTLELLKAMQANSDNEFVCLNYKELPELKSFEQRVIPNPYKWLLKTHLYYPHMINSKKLYDLDVIHNPAQIPTYFTPPKPYVITIHDLSPLLTPEAHKFGKRFIYKKLWPKTFATAKKIIAVSKTTEKTLHELYPKTKNKTAVVYEALPTKLASAEPDSSLMQKVTSKYNLPEKYILSVGSLTPRKNYEMLIRACANLWQQNKLADTELIIVGRKAWRYQNIFKLIKSLNLEKKVRIIETVTDEELPVFYQHSSLAVFPSLLEGFGLIVLEAMKFSAPVIVSKNSSLSEVAGDAALSINPYSISELEDAIVRIFENETLRHDLIAKGLTRINDFSWQKAATETMAIYKNVYENSPSK
ncbi:MAG: glycosyltransferase family 1 protein [bacterium]